MSRNNEIAPWRRDEAYEYLSRGKPGSEKEFRKRMRFGVQTWKDIKNDYKLKKLPKHVPVPTPDVEIDFSPPVPSEDVVAAHKKMKPKHDSEEWLEDRSLAADEALMEAVKKGNAGAIKIYYQLMGKLVDKPLEVNIGFTADDIVRERRRAEEELRSKGVSEVRTEPALLPEHVRLHSEQEHSEDS